MKIFGMLQNEKGVAPLLIGLIIGLIVSIGLALWSWSKAGEARTCLDAVQGSIMTYARQWEASKASGSPDQAICRQLNTFITNYNNRCGKSYGNLPLENCG